MYIQLERQVLDVWGYRGLYLEMVIYIDIQISMVRDKQGTMEVSGARAGKYCEQEYEQEYY